MDDVVNRFAKELADAIAAAVAENAQVEACRAKAREAGFDMRVTLEVELAVYRAGWNTVGAHQDLFPSLTTALYLHSFVITERVIFGVEIYDARLI